MKIHEHMVMYVTVSKHVPKIDSKCMSMWIYVCMWMCIYVCMWMCICECMLMCIWLARKRAPPPARFQKLVRTHLSAPERPTQPIRAAATRSRQNRLKGAISRACVSLMVGTDRDTAFKLLAQQARPVRCWWSSWPQVFKSDWAEDTKEFTTLYQLA